jgi:thioredoxin reductase (NADPH)
MMAADSGATVLEKKDDSPKMPDKKKTKFDVVIIGAVVQGHQDTLQEFIVHEQDMIL